MLSLVLNSILLRLSILTPVMQCLDYSSFVVSLGMGSVIPQAFLIFKKTTLGPLLFYMNFGISFSIGVALNV